MRLGGIVFLSTLLTIFAPFSPAVAAEHVWTDAKGEKIEAEFVDSTNGKVWLKPEGIPMFSVGLTELCPADRTYVADILRREKTERNLAPPGPDSIRYLPGRRIAWIACEQLDELSGMAASRRLPGIFWAHNDSGDDPRLYLLDLAGRDLGSVLVEGVRNFDWEDIASFDAEGKHYILIADTGNNGLNAAVHMIHVVEEPVYDPKRGPAALAVKSVPPVRTIYFSFEDDYRNCEAVAIDATDKTILLISKERSKTCHVYALPWPAADGAVAEVKKTPVDKKPTVDKKPALAKALALEPGPPRALVARVIGEIRLRQVTGMDISPDGRRAAVVTYGDAYEFVRRPGQSWKEAFARPPRLIEVPPRAQGESICYGLDGRTLYLSSEKRPTPLIEIPAAPDAARPNTAK
jgi:hypothetical protein